MAKSKATDSFELQHIFKKATPAKIYDSWMDSFSHAAMTGGDAEIDPSVGGLFTAWDGYIEGKTLELEPGKRILQEWRTSEFNAKDESSLLEIILEKEGRGTLLTLKHSRIPYGQGDRYNKGWKEHYFIPMEQYFRS